MPVCVEPMTPVPFSVKAGNALPSCMVHTPVEGLYPPSDVGILKAMLLTAESLLASSIASRRVHSVASQVASPGSAVELTV